MKEERDPVQNRRLVILIAIAALLGAGCGGASTASPTPTLTSTPTSTPGPTATQAATITPTAAPSATSSAGQMTHAHSTHTATALADGRVLLAGGYDGSGTTDSADLYDPRTGTFAATGPMTAARGFSTATRLSDGRALVAGGTPSSWDQSGPELASTELYDPRTGTFSATGSMTSPRDAHTATLLSDGRVLITGGDDRFRHPVASAELYDPKAGTFSPTGSMKATRSFHVATLLADGRVAGHRGQPGRHGCCPWPRPGHGGGLRPEDGEVQPDRLDDDERASHAGTRLADGRVLIAGGAVATATDAGSLSQASAELYDPKPARSAPPARCRSRAPSRRPPCSPTAAS